MRLDYSFKNADCAELILFSFLLLFCFQPAQAQKVNRDTLNRQALSQLIETSKELYYKDQEFRRLSSVFQQLKSDCTTNINPYTTNNDTIRLAFRLLWEDFALPQDIENTKRLIKITKKYGFPGMKRLGHDIPVFLVFVHTPKEYEGRVRKLIEKEYKAGRISKYGRDYVIWNLNGRGGSLPNSSHSINSRSGVDILRDNLIYALTQLSSSDLEKELHNNVQIKQNLSREELIADVLRIYVNDQKYRRMAGVFRRIINKCKGVKINPYNSDDAETRLAYWLVREDLIEKQDLKNTKQLIALTKQYGFPSMKRLGTDIPIFMVFAHTPYIYKYSHAVRKLIKREYQADRISKFARDYILWHLDGQRTGVPPDIPDTINHRTDIEIFRAALK